MATIFDVAKEAGVSKSTVSRVISNTGSVKDETRIAVEAAIKKLQYSPSYFAQGIRTGKTRTIAMLVPEYTNIFYGEMFRGVEDIALKHGYMVLVCNTERHADSETTYISELIKRNVDGIIYNTYTKSKENIDFLKNISKEIPVVFMDKFEGEMQDVSYVYTDGFLTTKKAVHYLYEQGKREIGYVRNSEGINITEDRYQGYLEGLKECGLPFHPEFVFRTDDEKEQDYIKSGKKAADYFISLKHRPEAILTTIDLLAIGCIKQLKEKGIRIPEEMNIIGYDNISLSELIEPALTTLSQPIRKLGQVAADIVIAKINGEEVKKQVVFEGELIIRDTTN